MDSNGFLRYRKNRYSQNGEDGVIEEILKRLNIPCGWFCEFGAWDGKYGSNTYALLKNGWQGLMIEGDEKRFKALKRTSNSFPDHLFIQNAFVEYNDSQSSLDNLLAKTTIPKDFDLLSIDIDSYDYHVWKSLKKYRPKLIIIEIDSGTVPGEEYIYDGSSRLTSFSAMLRLGEEKGYTLVCHTGNLFFLATEYVQSLKLDSKFLENPNKLFINDWLSPTKAQILRRKIKNMTLQRGFIKIENFLRD